MQPTMLETSRSHAAVGAFGSIGGALSAVTNATPIQVTTTSPNLLAVNDWVVVSGVTTDTGANGSFQVSVVTSSTQFTLGGSVGNGTASFGSATLSIGLPIASYTKDWTVRLRVESLTAGKMCQIALEDSADGFVADIVRRWSGNVQGEIKVGAMLDLLEARKYNIPGLRMGTASTYLRVYIEQIDAGATVVLSAWVES